MFGRLLAGRRTRSTALAGLAVLASSYLLVPATGAAGSPTPQSVTWMPGFDAPGTPAKYDKVGVLKVGHPSSARTSSSSSRAPRPGAPTSCPWPGGSSPRPPVGRCGR